MRFDRRAIALAIGWLVLLDILLRTSEGAISVLGIIPGSFRGIIRDFSYFTGYNYSGFSYILIGLLIFTLMALIALSLLILAFLMRAWTTVINITRQLVKYHFINDGTSDDKNIAEREIFELLFGDETMKSNLPLFWKSLRSLMVVWAILILVTIIAGIVSVMSVY